MYILGVKVDNVSMVESLSIVEAFLKSNQKHYIVTPNSEIILAAQKDNELRKILNEADLSIPDGIGLIFASKYIGQPLTERVAGTDLFYKICISSSVKNYRIFFLGGKNGVAQESAEKLGLINLGLKIFAGEDINKAVRQINDFGADIVFVGLGVGKQEKWIYENLTKMSSVKVAMGVGGAFDMISGRIKRAPIIVQKAGGEWAWRLAMEPWRLGRIYNAVILFPLKVLSSRFGI